MRETDHSTFRVLFLHTAEGNPANLPSYRLLNDLGHDVHSAHTTADAEDTLRAFPADLMVIDEPHPTTLAWLQSVDAHLLPRRIALYTPAMMQPLQDLRRLDSHRFHVFLRPLHVHGLLHLLRQLGRELELTA